MYLLTEAPPEFLRLDARSKELVREIIADITPTNPKFKISSNKTVFPDPAREGKLYLLLEGTLSYVRDGKTLFYFDSGDLVGIEHHLTACAATVHSDFAVIVAEYDANQIIEATKAAEMHRKWSEYLIVHSSLVAILSSSNLLPEVHETPPELRTYMPGEKILVQGAPGHEVFTLVDGRATVLVNDVRVGEILSGEMFGVFAALTNIPRTATVVADTICMALVLPREQFAKLLESQPATVLKMVEDMARTLSALNEQVVGLSISRF